MRLILPDDEYTQWGFGSPDQREQNGKWVAMTLAFSALGKSMTGLPIDFQIQQQTDANARNQGPRSALGMVGLGMVGLRMVSMGREELSEACGEMFAALRTVDDWDDNPGAPSTEQMLADVRKTLSKFKQLQK